MKLSYYIIIIMCLFINYGFGHDTNKAFFKIIKKDTYIVVKAEFPWTIRKALLMEFPELEKTKSSERFDATFFNYIKKNFSLKNDEHILEFLSVEKGETNGHSHQNNYVFTFRGEAFNTVVNSLMFNVSKSQENHHQLLVNGVFQNYITTINSIDFNIDENTVKNETDEHEKATHSHYYFYYVPVLVAIIGILFFGYNRRKQNA